MPEPRSDRQNWSRVEVEATVADYLEMLILELRGQPFNKAERNRNLLKVLDRRSRGAVEFKHENISAIMIESGLPYVAGYKPRRNYQELLREVVHDQTAGSTALIAVVEAQIAHVPAIPTIDDILRALVDRPVPRVQVRPDRVRERPAPKQPRKNYLLLEAANAALGLAGEQFVLNFETARLVSEGADRLANRVEQVLVTRGDAEGFDVLSFDRGGRDRLIEVKTTKYGSYTPFYVSRNELDVSKAQADRYHVYRVFTFGRGAQLFMLPGAMDESLALEASQYVARIG